MDEVVVEIDNLRCRWTLCDWQRMRRDCWQVWELITSKRHLSFAGNNSDENAVIR